MTLLEKPIHRKTRGAYSVLYFRRPRQLIVSLLPGDLIEFREVGRRTRFQIPIETAFRRAVTLKAISEAAEKRNLKKLRKVGAL